MRTFATTDDSVGETTYAAVDLRRGDYLGYCCVSEADAYLAGLTFGDCEFERDEDGVMWAYHSGYRMHQGWCSRKSDDDEAKAEIARELRRTASEEDKRYSTVKIERDDSGCIVAIDGKDDPRLIMWWRCALEE